MSAFRSPSLALAIALTAPTALAQEPAAENDVPLDAIPLPSETELQSLQENPSPAPASSPEPSTNVTLNLITRLVEKGILTQEEALVLVKQAEADAVRAKAAPAPVPLDPLGGDEVRVTYIPDAVRNQMRDQIQQELLAQAREEQWGASTADEWTSKFKFFGDFRGRYEEILLGDGNAESINFTNFGAINNGSPYNAGTDNPLAPPSFNSEEDRSRARIRARFGTEVFLGEGFNGGLRLATGESNSPTSPNQSLGASGGNFSKYAIWLDRAFLSYDAGPDDGEQELTFFLGRFENPFLSSEVQWDDDLGFDGIAVRGRVRVNDSVSSFFTAGYFPIFNTDFNFSSNNDQKFKSTDKWLTGAQLGVDWKIRDDLSAKVALSYYDFDNVEGRLSDPFVPVSANQPGNTDSTRPLFSQRGNTYMPLRNITPDAANGNGTTLQYQYYGLASEFRNLTLTGRVDYETSDTTRLSALAEATKNIGYDRSKVEERAYNNGLPGSIGDASGGDTAWYLSLLYGRPALEKLGDWQAYLGYRYVESDAVIDGFTDSDFGGGGTNLKGFTLGGNIALSANVRAGIRWMSADEIDGPPLSTDTIQFDLNAKF